MFSRRNLMYRNFCDYKVNVERDNSRSIGEDLSSEFQSADLRYFVSAIVCRVSMGIQCIGMCYPVAGRNYRQPVIGNASRNYCRIRLLIGVSIKLDGLTFNVGIILGSFKRRPFLLPSLYTFILKIYI